MPRNAHRTTLNQFLIDERRRFPAASGDFNSLILDVGSACKAIARAVAYGRLDGPRLPVDTGPPSAEQTQRLMETFSAASFRHYNEASGSLAGMLSGALSQPYQIPGDFVRGKYLLLFDPLDGSPNIDVDAPVGSVFSVLRAPDPGRDATIADFLQPGKQQVAAGYALYGASTVFILSVGRGVHGFTLDPGLGDFLLTHPNIQIPADTREFSINASNSRFWEPPVKRYVDECLKGAAGPRGYDYTMRWIASMVADAHRVLLRGGVFLVPRDTRVPPSPDRPQLLFDANPLAFLIEQAGGRASTGSEPVLEIQPSAAQQRIGLIFGSRNEVERIERYHREPFNSRYEDPLFAERGLFRD